jgi:hypothetical protein
MISSRAILKLAYNNLLFQVSTRGINSLTRYLLLIAVDVRPCPHLKAENGRTRDKYRRMG